MVLTTESNVMMLDGPDTVAVALATSTSEVMLDPMERRALVMVLAQPPHVMPSTLTTIWVLVLLMVLVVLLLSWLGLAWLGLLYLTVGVRAYKLWGLRLSSV